MNGTIVLSCTCEHKEQDKLYGKGKRLHNISGKSDNQLAYCTVCTPRNSPADKMAGGLSPMPHIGFKGTPPKRNKTGKPVPKR